MTAKVNQLFYMGSVFAKILPFNLQNNHFNYIRACAWWKQINFYPFYHGIVHMRLINFLWFKCYSYTLFPLLLLLDAAVRCRNGKMVNTGEKIGDLEVSDGIAEGVLMCIEALLKKCHLGSANQVLIIKMHWAF